MIFDTKLDSDKFDKGITKLANGAKVVGKAVAVGVTAGVTAVGALTVAATSAYADYEQLVGGVETLFKDSSKQVVEYANAAYKTAGLSANQYMETVTSFSASLLQSLGGDTEKASKQANQAVIDMSDNANKMGTSTESIQWAYQGFAKQNYTMLDNLKLGYGGTKEEMQRLLDDAEKISGIKYDISSFADVTQAIHVMQEEMGIAGTTAKEASETVSGSIATMKSAWMNLITGMGDKNADLSKLMNNFVESVKTVGVNLLPIVGQVLMNIGVLIEELLPEIMNAIPSIINSILPSLLQSGINIVYSLISGIQSNMPTIVQGAIDIISMLVTSLLGMLPQILQMGIDLIVGLAMGISEQLPTLIPLAIEAILNLVDTLLNNIDQLVDAGIALILGLADGLIDAIPTLIDKAPIIIGKLLEALMRNMPKIWSAGLELVLKLGQGIIDSLFKIPEFIGNLWESVTTAFKNALPDVIEVGKDIVKGLWDGVKSMGSWIEKKVTGFFDGVVDGVKDFLGIHSPSRLFKFFGQMVDEGFVNGIDDGASEVTRTVNDTFSNFDEPSYNGILSREFLNIYEIDITSDLTPLERNKYWIDTNSNGNVQYIPQTNKTETNQTVNFYHPVETPDETARAIRLQQTYGLAGT